MNWWLIATACEVLAGIIMLAEWAWRTNDQ